jgi:hypothetical protein
MRCRARGAATKSSSRLSVSLTPDQIPALRYADSASTSNSLPRLATPAQPVSIRSDAPIQFALRYRDQTSQQLFKALERRQLSPLISVGSRHSAPSFLLTFALHQRVRRTRAPVGTLTVLPGPFHARTPMRIRALPPFRRTGLSHSFSFRGSSTWPQRTPCPPRLQQLRLATLHRQRQPTQHEPRALLRDAHDTLQLS